MKFIVKATSLELTPKIYDHLEKRLGRLDKFVKLDPDFVVKARVELGRTTRHHETGNVFRAEVQLHLPRKVIRSEATAQTIFTAITLVKDELQQELKKYKGKKEARYKNFFRKPKERLRD